jgi:hypothetical protein
MRFLPEIPLQLAAILAVLGFIPLLPLTLRLSRVMWLGIGRDFSPDHFPGYPPDAPADPPQPSPIAPDGGEEEPVERTVESADAGLEGEHVRATL